LFIYYYINVTFFLTPALFVKYKSVPSVSNAPDSGVVSKAALAVVNLIGDVFDAVVPTCRFNEAVGIVIPTPTLALKVIV
jgi:hypothetical protein